MLTRETGGWNPAQKQKARSKAWDFPGGSVVKNPPASEGDTGLSPGPGRSHTSWSN